MTLSAVFRPAVAGQLKNASAGPPPALIARHFSSLCCFPLPMNECNRRLMERDGRGTSAPRSATQKENNNFAGDPRGARRECLCAA
jgi:hypothetical protein